MENNDFIAGWDDEYNLVALDVIRMNILRQRTIIHAPYWWGDIRNNPKSFVLILINDDLLFITGEQLFFDVN